MSKNNNQSLLDHTIGSSHVQKPSRSGLQGDAIQDNIFPGQNSHRSNQQNSNGYVNNQLQNSQQNSCEANTLVEQYKTYTKNFFSGKATAAGSYQPNASNQNSVLQQPSILQNGTQEYKNPDLNQYNNKENELRSSGYGNSNIGKGVNSMIGTYGQYNQPNGPYLQKDSNQQNKMSNQSTTQNQTTTKSFLNNASQHMVNTMTMNNPNSNFQEGYNSQEGSYYQSKNGFNSSHRDYAMRDITNVHGQADGQQQAIQQNSKQSSIYAQQINGTSQNNRIPQSSNIYRATGNMNQKGGDEGDKSNYQSQPPAQVSLQLGHSKSQIETQVQNVVVNNSVKTPIATQTRGLQNPRIIEKKFNLSGINQNQQEAVRSGQNSNQQSHRYKENQNNSAIVKDFQPVNGAQRKSSHGNASSMGINNVFKRVRSGGVTQGGSSSASGTSRYSAVQSQSNAHKQIQQNIRNIQLDKRLKELTNRTNETSQGYIDKYARQHQNEARVINKNINKSGENLTSNFQRALHQKNTTAQTQRSSAVVSAHGSVIGAANGRNIKNGVSGSSTAMSIASVTNTHNPNSSSLKNSVIGRSTVSSVTAKLIDQHAEKQNQRNQTKTQSQTHGEVQNLKRNKTSEGSYRPSQQLHNRGATHSHLQSLIGGQSSTSNHKKSNGSSANDHNSSVGTSHRNSTSQHNTNRSSKATISKSQGRNAVAETSKASSMNLIRKKSETNVIMKQEGSSASQKQVQALPPQIISNSAESHDTTNIATDTQEQTLKLNQFDQRISSTEPTAAPFTLESARASISIPEQIQQEMENRRKNWLKKYKTKLDLNDVLEIRNPQAVVEFLPEIFQNMLKEEANHMYPSNFLDKNFQDQISEKYRQYLVDWLAELHYKFKMWPETLYVTVGIIDKTLMNWKNFKKSDLQALGITALHIAGKYEEIYPPELKTILQVIDNAVTRDQVCSLESQILQCLDFNMVWPSVLRFMQRYSTIANYNKEQQMIAQMLTDFMLLEKALLLKKPSVLGAVAIFATNMITNKSKPWNSNLQQCTGGIKEEEIKPLAKQLFYFIKKLEASSLKTMFRKYELSNYLGVIKVISKIQMPQQQVQQQAAQVAQVAEPVSK